MNFKLLLIKSNLIDAFRAFTLPQNRKNGSKKYVYDNLKSKLLQKYRIKRLIKKEKKFFQ